MGAFDSCEHGDANNEILMMMVTSRLSKYD